MGQHDALSGADAHLSVQTGLLTSLVHADTDSAGSSAGCLCHSLITETHYRALFDALDDGFCVIEKVKGLAGEPLDFVYVEANLAFAVQSGADPTQAVVGKTIRQLFPNISEDWYTTYDAALTFGAPVRFERELVPGKSWLEVCVSPVVMHNMTRLAIIFKDITHRVLAQHTLHEAEAFNRSIVESSPDCIKVLDLQGNLLSMCNADKTLGIKDVTPFLNKPWLDFWHGDDRSAAQAALAIATGGGTGGFVGFYPTMAGEPHWWDVVISPIHDSHQRLLRLLVVSRDVTERKRDEEHARLRTEQFETLFNDAPVGIYLIDADFRLCLVNPCARPVFGPISELIGRDVSEVLHILWGPAQAEKTMCQIRHTMQTGQPIRTSEMIQKRADRQVTEFYEWQINRISQPDGRQGVACYFRDISERVIAQRDVSESEVRFRALFDHGPIAMYCVDAAGVLQEYNHNAQALWGREPRRGDPAERFCGASRLYLPDGTHVPHPQTPVADVLSGSILFAKDVEVLIERPDGSRITVIANVVPLKNAHGDITGAITCLYDITARSLMERQTLAHAAALADMDRRKDEFLAMLSHELRNPLAPISNAVRLLRLQKNEDPVQVQARVVIERQVGQLNRLVDDLLEVSRITTGQVLLRQENVAFNVIVERALESTHPLTTQRLHTLNVLLPAEPLWVYGDAARLEQVVVNLLTNAAKYTDEGGCITLNVALEDGNAVLRVQDNGIGIAPELLPRIFELFTQAERSLDRSQGGLGIGLCLVQRLVGLHGGTVAVHSVLGSGSEFMVRLPVVVNWVPVAPDIPAAAPSKTFCRVLVVDDNIDAAQTLADLLTMTGHEARLAYDGPGAVAAAVAWCPDVVLLDIGLPGLSGFEVAKRIRREAAHSAMVLVALTGYGQASDRQHSLEAGFDHHLVKPADFDEVEKILAAVVANASTALAYSIV